MMNAKRYYVALFGILLAGFVAAQDLQEPLVEPFPDANAQPFNFWMDVKLDESQKIFAALAKADFETLISCSKKLSTLSELEGFVRNRTPGYRTHLRSYQFAIREIEQQAKRGSIEGVTLGFQQLTLSCVNCHNQLRESEK
jgi:hypothetical protein